MVFIRNTKVKFDFTFFAVIALLIFVDSSGTAMLSLIASLLHETGHFIAMLICKAELRSVLFYGGGICIKSDKDILCFSKRLFIVSAGCFVNLIIAVIGFFILPYSSAVLIFATVNAVICLFNLIPVGYFDGAEMLDIICTRFLSLKKCELIKRGVGVIFSLAVISGFVLYCFVLKGNISISFLFVILYLILAQIVC